MWLYRLWDIFANVVELGEHLVMVHNQGDKSGNKCHFRRWW